ALAALMAATVSLGANGALAGPKIYVGNFKDNTVSVIDSTTRGIVATVPVATGPHGITITKDGRWVFVAGDGSSQVSVIDTGNDQVARTIEVGKSPHGMALTPDGRTLLVTVNGDDRLAFVDVAKGTVTGAVEVAKPHTVAIRPDGKFAYVSSQQPGKFALAVIDLKKSAVVQTVALEKAPRDVEFGSDGKLYYTVAGINAVQVLDPKSNKVVAEIPTGVSPHYANVSKVAKVGMAVVQGPSEL